MAMSPAASADVVSELAAIADAVARGRGVAAMDGASPAALEAMRMAHAAMDRCRRSGRPEREIPIRAAIAISMIGGIRLDLPSRGVAATTTLGPCNHCTAEMGARCRTPGGMPCRPHAGRRRS